MFRSVVVLMLSLILPTLASAQDTVQTQQRTHEVVKGETLWNLAQRYLGNPYRWPLIYEANASQIPNANIIEPGQILVIPGLAGDRTGAEDARAQQDLVQVEAVTVSTGRDTVRRSAEPEAPAVAPPAEPRRSPAEGSELFPWRRTTFYPKPTNTANQERMLSLARSGGLVSSSAITTVAVPRGIVYGSDWLIGPEQENKFIGTLEGFSRLQSENTPEGPARIGDRILVTPEPGALLQVGDLLQSFRPVRRERRLGTVQRPSGILVVTAVLDDAVVARVASELDRIWLGDWVQPAPQFEPVPGIFPVPVQSDITATILGFSEERNVQGYGAGAFLDVGTEEGIRIGDVFRAHVEEPGPLFGIEAARLQVILVSKNGSTARVVSLTHPGIGVGNLLRLVEKMQ